MHIQISLVCWLCWLCWLCVKLWIWCYYNCGLSMFEQEIPKKKTENEHTQYTLPGIDRMNDSQCLVHRICNGSLVYADSIHMLWVVKCVFYFFFICFFFFVRFLSVSALRLFFPDNIDILMKNSQCQCKVVFLPSTILYLLQFIFRLARLDWQPTKFKWQK